MPAILRPPIRLSPSLAIGTTFEPDPRDEMVKSSKEQCKLLSKQVIFYVPDTRKFLYGTIRRFTSPYDSNKVIHLVITHINQYDNPIYYYRRIFEVIIL